MFKGDWNKKLTKLFVYLSGYVSFIAFAIVGGYVVAKSDDKELRNTAKKVFIISLIYYAVLAFISIFSHFGSMSSNYYGSSFYTFLNVTSNLLEIVKIGVFAFLIIWELVKDLPKKKEEKDDSKNEIVEAEIVDEETKEENSQEYFKHDNE